MIVWWQTLYIIYIWYIIISLRFTSRTRCRTRRVIQCSSWTWLAARWSSEQWCPDRRTCAAVRLVRDRQPSTIHATQVHAAELTAAELTASVLAQQQSVLSSCCCCCCCCCCLATAPRPRCPRQRFGPAITCRGRRRRRRRRRQTLPCSASPISAQPPPCHALSHACLYSRGSEAVGQVWRGPARRLFLRIWHHVERSTRQKETAVALSPARSSTSSPLHVPEALARGVSVTYV
jgi:hypothetical protein